jgi:NAD(P)-dependent dehydrogenase (short-subunit alcohol dehydrogenase family)
MQNFLVIGASSGIGKQIVSKLIGEGNQVFGTYNQQPTVSDSDLVSYHHLDVTSSDFDLSFLPEQLDGLVYCPGSIILKPFERIKADDFIKDYELQVLGAIKTIQKAIPKLKKSDMASVVLFSTVAVQVGLPFHSVVSSSKGAIEGLTKALAAEYASKVRFNAIAPSLTDTPLAAALLNTPEKKEANAARHPMKRIGTVDDIAEMACFLLSNKSSWVTGQIFHIDGGMSTIKS